MYSIMTRTAEIVIFKIQKAVMNKARFCSVEKIFDSEQSEEHDLHFDH